jgi:phosphoglycolate phosphatase
MKRRAVIFDLDGTLLDTLADLADSANAALADAGYPTHPADAYRHFVGDGVVKLIERALPGEALDEATVTELVAAMRRQYTQRWDAKTRPYDGVAELLTGLAGKALPFAVLSNKPHDFTQLCVERLLGEFDFAVVQGVDDQTPPKPDPAGALRTAEAMNVAPAEVLYLGDTDTDMQTAEAAGFFAVGALWGFRDEAELRASGAQAVAQTPPAVLELL